MKKILLSLMLLVPGSVSAANFRYVQISTATTITPTVQTGNVNFSGTGLVSVSSLTAVSSFTATAETITTSTISSGTITTFNNQLMRYRKPVLKWASTAALAIETGNNGTVGSSTVIFPDGSIFTESQNNLLTSSVSVTANWGNGTQQGGIRPTETVSPSNQSEAVYVVKSTQTLVTGTTDFVVVMSTWLAIPANFAQLNANFGTNAWEYIGLARIGDNSVVATSILKFVQVGNTTTLYNSATGQALNMPGFLLVSAAATQAATYTYAVGTSSTSIPNNITDVYWRWYVESNTGSDSIKDATASTVLQTTSGSADHINWVLSPAVAGLQVTQSSASNHKSDILIFGWVDGALGGANSQL